MPVPAWMVPIMWVWTNSHGSFPLAVVLLVAVVVGRKLDGLDVRADLHRLGWAIAGVALACINPLGPKLLTFPLDLLDKTTILRNVLEWASPDFSTTGARLFLVQLLVALVALVRKPAWRSVVPSLVFVVLALLSLRSGAFEFSPGKVAREGNCDVSISSAVLDAMRQRDESETGDL